MKLNTSYIIAAVLLLLGAMWFAFNNSGEPAAKPVSTPALAKDKARQSMPSVLVRRVRASLHADVLELYGQSRANREVSVSANTAGIVSDVLVTEGRRVQRGQITCQQHINARQAQVDQERANMRSMEADVNAARILAEKGFQSTSRVTSLEAQMDGIKAAMKEAEIELENVNMRASFNGIWERQDAQVGDFLGPGQSCGLLVDLSPLKVDVQLTETQIGRVPKGSLATVKLATGETVTGKVAFVEAKADPATRTFRTEIQVPNDNYALRAGVTATVRISSGETSAQLIPGNILTLSDSGNVGVRYIDHANIVRFAEVRTIDESEDGMWVTGLPDDTRIIIEGQDFVAVGMEVEPSETSEAGANQVAGNPAIAQ